MSAAANRTVSVRVAVALGVALAACQYPRPDDVPGNGNPTDGSTSRICFGRLDMICLSAPPTASVVLAQPMIDTDDSASCLATASVGGADACVIAGTTVEVAADVRAVGSRPLIVIAQHDLVINAALSVGSSRAPLLVGAGASATGRCSRGLPPGTGSEGGGGGAGGSHNGVGGNGGSGEADGGPSGVGGVAGGTIAREELHAGCAGIAGGIAAGPAGGAGGAGGGALLLIAGFRLQIASTVSASGAGGSPGVANSGGGGGGSGGMIWLDAAVVELAGALIANGGGGGEGGGTVSGNPGADGSLGTTRAPGGTGATTGGNGGGGSGGLVLQGDPGTDGLGPGSDDGGGGGGGGGAGHIYIAGSLQQNGGTISPAPIVD